MKRGKENSVCVCVMAGTRRCRELEMIGRSGGSEVDNIFKALNYQRNERRSQLEGVTGETFLFRDGRDLGMFIC